MSTLADVLDSFNKTNKIKDEFRKITAINLLKEVGSQILKDNGGYIPSFTDNGKHVDLSKSAVEKFEKFLEFIKDEFLH